MSSLLPPISMLAARIGVYAFTLAFGGCGLPFAGGPEIDHEYVGISGGGVVSGGYSNLFTTLETGTNTSADIERTLPLSRETYGTISALAGRDDGVLAVAATGSPGNGVAAPVLAFFTPDGQLLSSVVRNVYGAAWSPDGQRLAIVESPDDVATRLTILDARTIEALATFDLGLPTDYLFAVSWSPSAAFVAVSDDFLADGRIVTLASAEIHSLPIASAFFVAEDTLVALAPSDPSGYVSEIANPYAQIKLADGVVVESAVLRDVDRIVGSVPADGVYFVFEPQPFVLQGEALFPFSVRSIDGGRTPAFISNCCSPSGIWTLRRK